MKKWWERLWCLHEWEHTNEITDIVYGKGFEYKHECKKCGKTINRFEGKEPISYIGE